MEYEARYQEYQQAIEKYLNGLFTGEVAYGKLYEAMRYAILGGGSVNSTAVSVNNNNNQQAAENQNLKKLYENLSKARPSNNLNKQIYRNLIYGEVQNGHITDSDASALFNEFGL